MDPKLLVDIVRPETEDSLYEKTIHDKHGLLSVNDNAVARYRRPLGECAYCDAHRDDSMMPPHTASQSCESGKRPHCTCDVCY